MPKNLFENLPVDHVADLQQLSAALDVLGKVASFLYKHCADSIELYQFANELGPEINRIALMPNSGSFRRN